MTTRSRLFLLSPASTSGLRAAMLLREGARFDLALRLRDRGAPIGEVFAFLSGLYFRGKLAYARRFAPEVSYVITSCSGLLSTEEVVRHRDLRRFARVPIAADEPRYRRPLVRDARRLREAIPGDAPVVLLGSIATEKYCGVLLDVFERRLRFPADFVGRGDMSRGGLLLRAARAGEELAYVPVSDATRHGPRPARLDPRTRVRETAEPERE
jgi:hypothetical protein